MLQLQDFIQLCLNYAVLTQEITVFRRAEKVRKSFQQNTALKKHSPQLLSSAESRHTHDHGDNSDTN